MFCIFSCVGHRDCDNQDCSYIIYIHCTLHMNVLECDGSTLMPFVVGCPPSFMMGLSSYVRFIKHPHLVLQLVGLGFIMCLEKITWLVHVYILVLTTIHWKMESTKNSRRRVAPYLGSKSKRLKMQQNLQLHWRLWRNWCPNCCCILKVHHRKFQSWRASTCL
jgi:hypothetical protein